MKNNENLNSAESVSNNREKYLTELIVSLNSLKQDEEYRSLIKELSQLKKLNSKITKDEIEFFRSYNGLKRKIETLKRPVQKKVIKGPIAYPSKMKMDAEKIYGIIRRKSEITALDLRKQTNLPPVRIYSILTQLMQEYKVKRKIDGRTYLYSIVENKPEAR